MAAAVLAYISICTITTCVVLSSAVKRGRQKTWGENYIDASYAYAHADDLSSVAVGRIFIITHGFMDGTSSQKLTSISDGASRPWTIVQLTNQHPEIDG